MLARNKRGFAGRIASIVLFSVGVVGVAHATGRNGDTAGSGIAVAGAPLSDLPVQVEGTVQDPTGAIIPQAQVRFSVSGNADVDVVADEAGAFRVKLPAGHYMLSAVHAGYEQKQQPVDLIANTPAHLTLTLQIHGAAESLTVTSDAGYVATTDVTAGRVPMRVLDTPQFDLLGHAAIHAGSRCDLAA